MQLARPPNRERTMTRVFLALCVAAGLLALADVQASPLDADACARLKVERGVLEQAGVRTTMAKGPDWAKGNLASDKLQQIQRMIELDGQLLFRCSGQTLVELPASVEADPAAVAPPDGNAEGKDGPEATPKAEAQPGEVKKAPAPPAKAPAAKTKADDKAKQDGKAKQAKEEGKAKQEAAPPAKAPAKKAAPTTPPTEKAPAEKAKVDTGQPPPDKSAAAKPKPKPKAKVDDAYKAPPPADANANPFPKLSP